MAKIVLIGDTGVGKTSILKKICGSNFREEVPPTIGIDFLTRTVDIGDDR